MCVHLPKELMETAMEMGVEPDEAVNMDTGFMRKCGKCHDPCAPEFKPEMDKEKKMEMESK